MGNRPYQLKITDFYNGYIPEYRGLDSPCDGIWKLIDIPFLCVNYFTLKKVSLFKECLEKTLAEALEYDGKIILVGLGPDIELVKITNSQYLQDIKKLNPDYVTSLDTYTYYTDPDLFTWHQTSKAVYNASYLLSRELESEVIPTIKGANQKQICWCVDRIKEEFEIKAYMFPCQELSQRRRMREIYTFLRKMRELKAISFLYGFSNPKNIKGSSSIFPSYTCSLSYFRLLNQKKVYYFDENGNFQRGNHEKIKLPCNLSCCEGKTISDIKNKKQLIIHNICVLNKIFSEEKKKRRESLWALAQEEEKRA